MGTSRRKKEINVTVNIKTIPHPEPDKALDLVANIILEQIIKEKESKNG